MHRKTIGRTHLEVVLSEKSRFVCISCINFKKKYFSLKQIGNWILLLTPVFFKFIIKFHGASKHSSGKRGLLLIFILTKLPNQSYPEKVLFVGIVNKRK